MNSAEELVKLQCLQAVFGAESRGVSEPGFLCEIKDAIEFSITGDVDIHASLARFSEALGQLVQSDTHLAPSSGFSHLDLSRQPLDPLWARSNVLRELKLLAGFRSAVLLVSGLRQAVRGPRRYWTRRLQDRYRETIEYIDGVAALTSAPSTRLKLIYL